MVIDTIARRDPLSLRGRRQEAEAISFLDKKSKIASPAEGLAKTIENFLR